ncbi:MAG TPA: S9 family peptidase [Acidisarcina sp.]|nr:S9 family peptidase [Acidisarcina sp.]
MLARRSALSLLLFAALLTPAVAQNKRPMQFDDLMKMHRLGGFSISPDGKWVIYAATDADLEKNSKTTRLWVIPTAGGDARPLTASLDGEDGGRFSPDGKQILFTSAREGSQQIYVASFDGTAGSIGAQRKITSLSTEADGAMWSPDGKQILFTSSVYPDCKDDACNKSRDAEKAASKVKARIFTELLYRHWNAYVGEKRSHLFLIPSEGGTPRDLNPGDTHDIPPFSLGGPDAYGFSPDGKEIAFTENLDPVPAISTNADIFTLRLDDPNARPVKISTSAGGDFSPAYSRDGRYIAFRSQARAGYESDRFRLMVYDRAAKTLKEVLPKLDRWVDEFAWAPDSKTLYFVSGDRGEAPVFSVNLDGSDLRSLTQAGEYGDLHAAADGHLFATRMTVQAPSEIVRLDLASAKPLQSSPAKGAPTDFAKSYSVTEQPITHLNDALLAQLDLPAMESFWFPSLGKVEVQGFLIKPPAFDAAKKYPVKFLIHGGPQGAWGDSWSYRWNAEYFAANGYAVVMINPRGSTGYGQTFTDGVNGDWGGKPYIDLMRGLDYAEQHYSFLDKSRECALGASYGGFMANWILGHTDRFKCIVSHDGMFNPESAYGSTEELWFNEWEFKGRPWDYYGKAKAADPFRKWAPSLYAKNFKTPTLVIHGQLDYRLDVAEGFQLFTTLQRLKVPSKMLYFPDEGHWVLKPQNSRLWNQVVSDWVEQWTGTSQPGPSKR